jgi:hypothetical protein
VFFLSLFLIPGRWIESESPVSLKVIHHRQNPIVTTSNLSAFAKPTLTNSLLKTTICCRPELVKHPIHFYWSRSTVKDGGYTQSDLPSSTTHSFPFVFWATTCCNTVHWMHVLKSNFCSHREWKWEKFRHRNSGSVKLWPYEPDEGVAMLRKAEDDACSARPLTTRVEIKQIELQHPGQSKNRRWWNEHQAQIRGTTKCLKIQLK